MLPVRKTWAFSTLGFQGAGGEYAAPNPPAGALLAYHLREESKGKIAVKISDADGKTIREISGSSSPGLHRVNWDLRLQGAAGGGGRGGGGGGRGGGGGTLVRLGTYTATLVKTVGETPTVLGNPQSFEVVPMPKMTGP